MLQKIFGTFQTDIGVNNYKTSSMTKIAEFYFKVTQQAIFNARALFANYGKTVNEINIIIKVLLCFILIDNKTLCFLEFVLIAITML